MSDYIKREDVQYTMQKAFEAVQELIPDIPTTDVVEVVRCKDCKYWDSDCIWCDLWGNTQEYDDGYCNYGERKENE